MLGPALLYTMRYIIYNVCVCTPNIYVRKEKLDFFCNQCMQRQDIDPEDHAYSEITVTRVGFGDQVQVRQ